jgi:hypothetical protein
MAAGDCLAMTLWSPVLIRATQTQPLASWLRETLVGSRKEIGGGLEDACLSGRSDELSFSARVISSEDRRMLD